MQSAASVRRVRGPAVFVLVIIGVAAAVGVLAVARPWAGPSSSSPHAVPQGLSSFESYAQLQQYMAANAKSAQQYQQRGVLFGGPLFGGVALGANGALLPQAAMATSSAASSAASSPSFTGTNVQVQGVDEPDTVKTDGTHLFVSNQDSVSIIRAYPPNSTAVLSTLRFSGMAVLGLEVSQGRLMVIGQTQPASYQSTPAVELLLYDVSDLSAPKMVQNDTVAGSYVAARMAGGYLYAVIQQPSYVFDGQGNATAVMPTASHDGIESRLAPTSVYYTPIPAQISYYTMIPSVDMATGNESVVSVLTGPSATVYVSTSNIYVVYTNYLDLYDADGIPGDFYSGGVITPQTVQQQSENSTILRASYSNGTVTVAKAGVVPGTVLNQFSLDEYDGYFRVATSRFAMVGGTATTSDDIYVLNQNMTQVASLVNLAPGENIYAVRFVGQVGYVVTFQQVDPLFAISFNDVSHPVVLSALKVSGYSDYLQQLWGGYLIGVGKDTVPASDGNYSYYLGLKLSLFKVLGNGTSAQVAKLSIGDRGTDSPVLTDHLALTFDPANNITVIPLTLYKVSGNQSAEGGIPPYGDPVWQGAYVIRMTQSGFDVLGNVTQYPSGQSFGDSPDSGLQVYRSVIIGGYLYTISQSEVMVSSLADFSTLVAVQLPG